MTIKIYLLIFVSFFIFRCKISSEVDKDAENDFYLKKMIATSIEQKKNNEYLREKFYRSRFGEQLKKYKPVIKKYSKRYGFDWRLITAQIVQESGFKIQAKSRVGALGLMQIMPETAKEISGELDIEYIFKNPQENITAGIYHLSKQYALFPDATKANRLKLALASYNGGVGRVFDAQTISRFYQRKASEWENVSPYLSKLRQEDWELHLQVWPTGKPRYGYFYGSEETVTYVNSIWKMYRRYKVFL
jgi:membrane-bound lytic murein transglycosylase F